MGMELYNRTTPKARKDYKCEYCEQTITKGEIHSCETGKYDGDMFSRRLDIICYNMMDKYLSDSGEEEFTFDGVDDWLRDNYCYDCEHGDKKEDDCEQGCVSRCPIIRQRFAEEEVTG